MGDFSADIHYLMREDIGKVIAEGLSVLYEQKPTHPIDYLAKWLLSHAATEKNRAHAHQEEKKRGELMHKYQEHRHLLNIERDAKKHKEEEAQKVEDDYRKQVIHHEYHNELLPQSFPNFIEKQKGFSGVYLGHYDHPTRQITDDIDDELAHIDFSQPRQINYIGASDSHHFMIGKNLPPKESEIAQTKTVTYEVFKEKEAQPVDPDGNPEPEPEKPIYYYVPDVTMEDRIYYFRLPRLGAYLACPLIYESCLYPDSFDAGVEARNKFQEDKIDFELRKKQKAEERDEKLAELEEGSEEYQALIDRYNEEIETMEPPVEAAFLTKKKEYVVCIDTLGQDREISEEDRKYVEELVKLFAKSWEEKEKHLLSHDINMQLEYSKDLDYSGVVEEYTKRLQETLDQAQLNPSAPEQETEYTVQTMKVEFYKELLHLEEYRHKLKELSHFRVLKYPWIIQNALYLVGYHKDKVDLVGTNVLDWKHVKNHLHSEDLYKKLRDYQWSGPKTHHVEKHAYINRIQRRIDALAADIDEVDRYNLGLGLLLKFLKHLANLRVKDILKRRSEKAYLRDLRNQAIDSKAEWDRARQEAVDNARKLAEDEAAAKQAELNAQRQQDAANDGGDPGDPDNQDDGDIVPVNFDEAVFFNEWDSNNAMPEIPDEVVDDIDLDLEPDNEQA